VSNFFADVCSKIIALADPVLSQPDMEWEMVSPPAGVYSLIHDLPPIAGPSRFLSNFTARHPSSTGTKFFATVKRIQTIVCSLTGRSGERC
jgi:hypothetical protein